RHVRGEIEDQVHDALALEGPFDAELPHHGGDPCGQGLCVTAVSHAPTLTRNQPPNSAGILITSWYRPYRNGITTHAQASQATGGGPVRVPSAAACVLMPSSPPSCPPRPATRARGSARPPAGGARCRRSRRPAARS